MDRSKFNEMGRRFLTEISRGKQAMAFDIIEMNAWADDYIRRNGRRPKAQLPEDDLCQNATACRDSASKAASGKSRNVVNTPKAAGSVKARENQPS
jgi:hypothetical protein